MTREIASSIDGLEIVICDVEEGITMRLCGRLNIDSSPTFRDQLLASLQPQSAPSVIVDFSDVFYVDSSGIATLIEGLKVARQRKKTLCLHGLEGPLLHLFQVTGMSTLFEKSGCRRASLELKVS